MFKKSIVSVFILAIGFASTQANAAFVATDWKSDGDKKATLDTTTGIEWLKLTQTLGNSLNDIMSRLDTDLKGWRLPTAAEVSAVTSQIWGGPAAPDTSQRGSYTADAYAKQTMFESVFGRTHYWSSNQYQSMGIVYEATQGAYVRLTGVSKGLYFSTPTIYRHELKYHSSYDVNFRDASLGVYLVNDGGITLSSINNPMLNINNPKAPVNSVPETPTDVPVHAGFGLLGLLLMAFCLRRRKSA